MKIRKEVFPNERRVSSEPIIPLNPIQLLKDIILSHLERCVTLAVINDDSRRNESIRDKKKQSYM